jgi:hypothetical protein
MGSHRDADSEEEISYGPVAGRPQKDIEWDHLRLENGMRLSGPDTAVLPGPPSPAHNTRSGSPPILHPQKLSSSIT